MATSPDWVEIMAWNQSSKAAAIIPALNEQSSIALTLVEVPRVLFCCAIVVDNGSTDNTAEVAASHGAVVVREPRRGYGRACLAALKYLPAGVEVVCFLQADGSEKPEQAAQMIDLVLEDKADLVIGSRVLGNAHKGALAPHQKFGNWLATRLIRLLYGFAYTDLGPFRAIRRSSLEHLGMKSKTYGWTVEMQIRALLHGLRVVEVPVDTFPRAAGESKVTGSLRASLAAGSLILWYVFRLLPLKWRTKTRFGATQ